jgi:hypothetical protein
MEDYMKFEDFAPELQEKAFACTSTDELLELAKAEGVELTDEALDMVSGGSDWYCASVCPQNNKCVMVECKTK